jgi:phosphoribosylglycinamide formyltransferase-1
MGKFQIGLFTSAWGNVSWELVAEVHRNVRNGLIPNSEIAFVFVSRDEGETHFGDLMIRNVRAAGLPLITFSSLRFQPLLRKENLEVWRLEHDRQVMQLLPSVDLIVLVGYMWWLGKEMCQKETAINLHPASPAGPKGTYREVIYQLIQQMAAETGVMMHLVTPELDRGPVITFCHFPIRGGAFNSLWEKMGKRLEKETLDEIAEKEGENNSLFKLIRQQGVIREFPMI